MIHLCFRHRFTSDSSGRRITRLESGLAIVPRLISLSAWTVLAAESAVFFIEPAVNPPSPEMRPTVVKILSTLGFRLSACFSGGHSRVGWVPQRSPKNLRAEFLEVVINYRVYFLLTPICHWWREEGQPVKTVPVHQSLHE